MIIKIPREQKLQILESLQNAFEEQFEEPIGQLAAEEWLNTMLRELSPIIYNQAITDAKTVLLDRMSSLEDELYALQKPLRSLK